MFSYGFLAISLCFQLSLAKLLSLGVLSRNAISLWRVSLQSYSADSSKCTKHEDIPILLISSVRFVLRINHACFHFEAIFKHVRGCAHTQCLWIRRAHAHFEAKKWRFDYFCISKRKKLQTLEALVPNCATFSLGEHRILVK